MKFITNILSISIALITLISSNGFILEQYFCSSCNTEHNEVALFEFGEINHEHHNCDSHNKQHHDCESHETQHHDCENHEKQDHDCSCNSDDHLKNTHITYISLDVLFINISTIDFSQTIVKTLKKSFGKFQINLSVLSRFNENHFIKENLHPPPLIRQFYSSTNFCTISSIFRL